MSLLVAAVLASPMLSWATLALALDRWGVRQRPEGRWDALVVAGAAVRADGTASGALARRTAHAVALWRAGLAPRVCFTGGLGRHGPTEAEVGAALAVQLGLPADCIVLEPVSTSTEENASEAARRLGALRVVVVTDSYHGWRCRLVFRRHFAEVAVATTRPPARVAVRMALREVIVTGWYAATRRLG